MNIFLSKKKFEVNLHKEMLMNYEGLTQGILYFLIKI